LLVFYGSFLMADLMVSTTRDWSLGKRTSFSVFSLEDFRHDVAAALVAALCLLIARCASRPRNAEADDACFSCWMLLAVGTVACFHTYY
jgi:hypothetical protein